jgi:hypothetical protein
VAQSPGNKSTAKYSANRLTSFIIEPQASYVITLKHNTKLSALVGSTYQNSITSYKVTSAVDFNTTPCYVIRSTLLQKLQTAAIKITNTWAVFRDCLLTMQTNTLLTSRPD